MAQVEGAGGEEWKSLELKRSGYDAERWKDLVAAAAAAIERIRKREVRLRLVDRTGKPLAGRPIELVQLDSDFLWGFCGWGIVNNCETRDQDLIRHRHGQVLNQGLCNAVNLMHYWAERHCDAAPVSEEYQGYVDYESLDRAVTWALGNNLVPKGHPLYWPCGKAIPEWVLRYDVATRRKFLEVRIRQITARFKGRIKVYDAVNEMMWEPTLAHTQDRHWPHLEPIEAIADEAAQVIGWAREEDPEAIYTLNEYGLGYGDDEVITVPANDGSTITRHQQFERYLALAKRLIARGEAPDALGLQTPPGDWGSHDLQVATYNRLGEETGLPIHITEFRTGTEHLAKLGLDPRQCRELLTEYLTNTITLAFGNPHLEGFWFWSVPDLVAGRKPTEVYHRLRTLIRERWRTRSAVTTDADGCCAFRGFHGAYSARIRRPDGQVSGHRFQVPAATARLELELRVAVQ